MGMNTSSNVKQLVVLRNGNSLKMIHGSFGYSLNIYDPHRRSEIEVYYHNEYDDVDKMFNKIVDLFVIQK